MHDLATSLLLFVPHTHNSILADQSPSRPWWIPSEFMHECIMFHTFKPFFSLFGTLFCSCSDRDTQDLSHCATNTNVPQERSLLAMSRWYMSAYVPGSSQLLGVQSWMPMQGWLRQTLHQRAMCAGKQLPNK